MGTHYFVDETKAKGYVVVAVACPTATVGEVRSALRQLVLPGQRSIHMKAESARRRRQILSTLAGLTQLGVQALVFDAGRGPASEVERRGRCLDALGQVASSQTPASILLDLDETLVAQDRRRLYAAVASPVRPLVSYSHARRHDEPLLALPDIVAWAWARGGEWRRRAEPLIAMTTPV